MIDKLFGIFNAEYKKLDVPFYEHEAWNRYLGQYKEISFVNSTWDLIEAVNHNGVFKGNPVAIPNPSGRNNKKPFYLSL